MATVEFSREEMFEKIWSRPALQIAQEIGVSDVALLKACRRASIPLPGRGYWAKPVGRRPSRPKLLPLADESRTRLSFHVLDADSIPKIVKHAAPIGPTEPPIVVPDKLVRPHTLVAACMSALKRSTTHDGLLYFGDANVLDIRVSKESMDRALRLMDTLIKNSEADDNAWSISPEGKTIFYVHGQPLKVFLREKLTRKDRERPPPPPRPSKTVRGSDWVPNAVDTYFLSGTYLAPTGVLFFQIDEWTDVRTQRIWSDTRNTVLEERLRDILAGAKLAAAAVRAREERLEADRKEWARKAAEKEAAARVDEETRRLRLKLSREVEYWERWKRIEAFCAWIEREIVPTLASEDAGAAMAWLAWAREQGEVLRPVFDASFFKLTLELGDWRYSEYGPPKNHGWWAA